MMHIKAFKSHKPEKLGCQNIARIVNAVMMNIETMMTIRNLKIIKFGHIGLKSKSCVNQSVTCIGGARAAKNQWRQKLNLLLLNQDSKAWPQERQGWPDPIVSQFLQLKYFSFKYCPCPC